MSLEKAVDLLSTGLPSSPPSPETSLLLLIANIFAPGTGTLATAYLTHRRLRSSTTYVGIAQLCTVGLIGIGWLWAIAWGFLLWRKARKDPLSNIGWRLERRTKWVWVRRWVHDRRAAEPRQVPPRVANVAFR